MSDRNLDRISAATAAEVCQHFRLGSAAAALLRDDQTLGQFLDLLTARGLFKDATRLLAYALPKREAVWWAVLCVREVVGPLPPEPVIAGLRAAEAWVEDVSGANRWTGPAETDRPTDGMNNGTEPQAAAAVDSARPAPATASKRAARLQWD
jgi:hypothetical protein